MIDGLVLAPSDRSAIWLGKVIATLSFLVLAEIVALPAFALFFSGLNGGTLAGVALADVGRAHDEAMILRAEKPGADVGVVVERRHDDLVARLERAAERVHEIEVDRGHVGPEDDLLGLATEKVGGRHARPRPRPTTTPAGGVR